MILRMPPLSMEHSVEESKQRFYLELYKEYRTETRHQETQRSAVSAASVALAGGLIGLGFQERSCAAKLWLGFLLVNFSLLAILMLRKLYERFALGRTRSLIYLKAIDGYLPLPSNEPEPDYSPDSLYALWLAGRDKNGTEFPFFSFVRLHKLWQALLLGSIVVGIAFVFWNVPQNGHPWWRLTGLFLGPCLTSIFLIVSQRRERNSKGLNATP